MFPDSKIAQSFELGPTKVHYIINFGIAPYFRDILYDSLKKVECYVVSFDESLNTVTQNCEMDVLVRFFDPVDDKVKICYLDSSFLGHSAHQDLFSHFTKTLGKLDPNKMFQVSMDGPSVNFKFLEKVQKDRLDNEQHQLIDIGSCGLHTIHGAFKNAAVSTEWNIKKILHGSYQILHDTPARRDDYESVTSSNVYPLNFCATRWVEDKVVAERLIEIWENIVKIVKFWEGLPKSKRPASKSYGYVKDAAKDLLTPAKLKFFSFLAGILQPFLVMYQTDKPMVPYMYQDLTKLLKNLMRLIVKPDVLTKCESISDLKAVNLNDNSVLMKPKNYNLGFATRFEINELKRKDLITNAQVAKFFTDAVIFVRSIVEKLFDKSPLSKNVVKNSTIFDPKVMVTESSSVLQTKLRSMLTYLVKLRVLTSFQCDKITEEFNEFSDHNLKLHIDKFQSFDRFQEDLDEFYFGDVGVKSFKELSFFIKLVLTLSHGQASVERSFSINNSVLRQNMKEESIVAKKVVSDHMIANGLKPDSIQVTNKLLQSVASARQKYEDSLELQRQKKRNERDENQKRILNDEIRDTKAKRDDLQKTCEALDKEFVSSVEKAEKDKDNVVSLVTKANALKRRSVELKTQVKSLDEALLVLEEKRRKVCK
ncbi:uncharacterized protein LOC130630266 [Hydractinia symbiolongicarpus]|uniref:uncharacterized protein LOC130630266 n=1 Tax=Hydractinia symbiolongicarpus TaxID=13093 RepID=UPI002549D3DC|nr:uncharacterized protein LOC130630266 [Hydractinia symbiolongicarpus]